MSNIIKATYSPEDNKLRFYAEDRLDDELYQQVKSAGFNWAPKQKLFVAPSWSPAREDFLLELAGDIEPEGLSLADRAEAKIERINGYAENKLKFASGYMQAANSISEQLDSSQPILAGHHSERKITNAGKRVERNVENAAEMIRRYNYWNWKERGVASFANQNSDPRTIHSRIKRLQKELRDLQRSQNHAEKMAKLWVSVDQKPNDETKTKLVKQLSNYGRLYGVSTGTWSDLDKGEKCPFEVASNLAKAWSADVNNEYRSRWLEHTLNRLGFEQSRLPEVLLFDGELTSVIIQAFVRTHGGDKPKAIRTDIGWSVTCNASLPLHIGQGTTLDLSAEDWCLLMQGLGYSVEVKAKRKSTAPKKASLINPTIEAAMKVQAIWNNNPSEWNKKNGNHTSEIVEMTQAQYSDRAAGSYGPCSTVNITHEGAIYKSHWRDKEKPEIAFRLRIMQGESFAPDRVVVITDKPQKELPL